MLATLLDSLMGCAIQSLLPLGRGYTTLEIKVSYVRGVRVSTGEITAEGRKVHLGRQTAPAEGTIRDGRDRVLATATTTCSLFDLPGQQPRGGNSEA